mmetsp:Transcript_14582/g.35132  ORF Transcript_14582/g.35132 Transcript_14582/m.35132 type:complete len:212 (+) Transcript_14582:1535-2170(+)
MTEFILSKDGSLESYCARLPYLHRNWFRLSSQEGTATFVGVIAHVAIRFFVELVVGVCFLIPTGEARGCVSPMGVCTISVGKDPALVASFVHAGVCRPFAQCTFSPIKARHDLCEEFSEVLFVGPVLLPFGGIHLVERLDGYGHELGRVGFRNRNQLVRRNAALPNGFWIDFGMLGTGQGPRRIVNVLQCIKSFTVLAVLNGALAERSRAR